MTTSTMQATYLRDLFLADITRDIPPVIYFGSQDPAQLQVEVDEYIITGGYPEDHPHHTRVPNGIHEQFVRLLSAIARGIEKPTGSEPAAWISGFYGSGKSSFAKLLGLGLDGRALPDGRTLADALLARDTSPKSAEFHQAWQRLAALVDPIAVVFDIGGKQRGGEFIHAVVLRALQKRLGYCTTHTLVAQYELRLERDQKWPEFLQACEQTLQKSWDEAKNEAMAEDHFAHVLHTMYPDRYLTPTAWIDGRAGLATHDLSVDEAVRAIADMLGFRAPGKTLFIVIDEVSQFIHNNQPRTLALQSFASALSAELNGRAWLLVTGQEKLESESEATMLGKLKGRFPTQYRVHLNSANIRDVVHKRLLQKTPAADTLLRDLFVQSRSNLQLFAYQCADITVDDFVEIYPMLPGHIDMLMEITTAMRTRSTQVQGDTHAIRGLIQLLGELFRAQNLAAREVGHLISFDDIYDVQASAMDTDTQNTMAKVQNWCATHDDQAALRVAKVIALLQLIQETQPTTAELVARCLYNRLDLGDNRPEVQAAIDRLTGANLVTHSTKSGYQLQSNAGQEWMNERERIAVPQDRCSELVRKLLSEVLEGLDKPRLFGNAFEFSAWFSDSLKSRDVQLKSDRNQPSIPLDFQFVGHDERNNLQWVQRSEQAPLSGRIVWVVGQSSDVLSAARDWGRSMAMIQKYDSLRGSLVAEKVRLLMDEHSREQSLKARVLSTIEDAWMSGTIYFRGLDIDPRDKGGSLRTVLYNLGTEYLPALYPHYSPLSITDAEIEQLRQDNLTGPSLYFMPDHLGILDMDAGSYVVNCKGTIPSQILRYIETAHGGIGGKSLFDEFGGQPYGYHSSVIRACLLGLLRAKKIMILPESTTRITSYRDPGTQDLFKRDRDLRRANILVADQGGVGPRDIVRICKFFKERLNLEVNRELEAIADAAFHLFPQQRDHLAKVKTRFAQLPDQAQFPDELARLEQSLNACLSSRLIEKTCESILDHLDALNDGIQQLGIYRTELTDDAISAVRRLADLLAYEFAQLESLDSALSDEVRAAAERIETHLTARKPWAEITALSPDTQLLRDAYQSTRQGLITQGAELAEEAVTRLKLRPGFAGLNPDQSHHVLRPIREALSATDARAIAPDLRALLTEQQAALPRAIEEAHDRLDRFLTAEVPVVKMRHNITNQTITTQEELDLVLIQLRKRVEEQLKNGHHVRLF